jgi:Protein of unknown function (DUF2851)
MTEKLLQFIWQFKYFNTQALYTRDGEPITIIYAGQLNTNQGPDFLEAKIKIGETIFVGHVEIHVKESEWVNHKHSSDANYNNVILHVVWEEDKQVQNNFPLLNLSHKVSKTLLGKYTSLMQSSSFIPCEKQINTISSISFNAWKERLFIERLQDKSTIVLAALKETNNNWEEVFWQMLAKNFGIKVNTLSFETMAKSMPITILAKHKNQIHQLEALLMGQCGLLEKEFVEDYPIMLQKEYRFLKQKYSLSKNFVPVHFLRMRPANFPTLRLAQLASLIFSSNHLFSKIKELQSVKDVEKLFDVVANDYWHYHYTFEDESSFKIKSLGKQMIQNIIINTVLPVLYAYGWYHNNEDVKNKTIAWAEEIPKEKNNITEGFAALGIQTKNAFDSQALIQLKNKYCNEKRCLQCAVGFSLLK